MHFWTQYLWNKDYTILDIKNENNFYKYMSCNLTPTHQKKGNIGKSLTIYFGEWNFSEESAEKIMRRTEELKSYVQEINSISLRYFPTSWK